MQFQRLNGVCEETPRRFEYRVGIPYEVYELRIGEHFEQLGYSSGIGRVFREIPLSSGIPHREFYKSRIGFLVIVQFLLVYRFEEEVLFPVLGSIPGKYPEIVERIRGHVSHCKLFFLRLVGIEFQIVGGTFLGHRYCGHLFEKALHEEHQKREYGLVRGRISELFVAGKDIMHECRSAAPVSDNEYRRFFYLGIFEARFVSRIFNAV